MNKLLEAISKFPTVKLLQREVDKMYRLEVESKVNLHIAEKFLMSLIDGQCVVNTSHKKEMKVNPVNQNIVTPEEVGWKGLGIGKWYLYSLSLSFAYLQ